MPNPPTALAGQVLPDADVDIPHDGVVVIVGPNGSGKTRLGAAIEAAAPPRVVGGTPPPGQVPRSGARLVVRIGAQRAVALPESVQLLSQADAESLFNTGGGPGGDRSRVIGDPATGQMQDYAALVQLLFARQNATANAFHAAARAAASAAEAPSGGLPGGAVVEVPRSVLERVVETWEALYPHRRLVVSDQRIRARAEAPDSIAGLDSSALVVMESVMNVPTAGAVPLTIGPPAEYGAGQLSDGERAGFYLIGHALLAEPGTTLLVDEPETYLHPDLQRRLWDALEAARPDCAFVYLTHNLDFAASRRDAPKIVVRDYAAQRLVLTGVTATVQGVAYPVAAIRNQFWTWAVVAPAEGVPEDVVLRIAGARRPTLFVEGDAGSLDAPLYRALYPTYDVVPAGPCEQVIRNVRALGAVPRAHRLAPAGIVDPDDRDAAEQRELARDGVHALGYAQVENVYLDERVFRAVLAMLREREPDARFADLRRRIAQRLDRERDPLVRRRAVRALDRRLGAWAPPARGAGASARDSQDEADVAASFVRAVGAGDPAAVVADAFAAAGRVLDEAREGLREGRAAPSPVPSVGLNDASSPAAPPTGDPAYRRALAVLRNKGVEADAAAAAGVHGVERYRRLALAAVTEREEVRAALADVAPALAGDAPGARTAQERVLLTDGREL